MSEPSVVGIHGVRAALKYDPARVDGVWVERGRRDRRMEQVRELAQRAGVKVYAASRRELDAMAEGAVHQGVVARLRGERPLDEGDLERLLDGLAEPAFLLVVDQVQDPHNLGACLRSADAAGVHAVIAPRDRAVGLTPVVHKVASGATRTTPFIQVTNLARTLEGIKRRGVFLVGCAGEADHSLYQQDLTGPIALVMGAEGEGMRRLTREHCDFLVRIPMVGHVESLNVSVATGIVLFEALRQRIADSTSVPTA
ncbi:23S rRNA (guanosine2251-2'-O)-methyltransferase [Natronocella acetinitrilica]|uniref:23S rRNA (guanosine-2'-O-)-methyltransferase RlmB n=1 Tax=Natronocella acetinitrilica TaxID=414046 RepID=A0AAE3KB12_9GAMM|nr:23S rRNA (guanosine(2251)-2'-O)-methyltransferase RlmB [Natronocella acetinitrilica]MCP1675020.1 23S rRNA (guanosine2251-2'-O)-methyltransferase [Natronocella acetinitrilica]